MEECCKLPPLYPMEEMLIARIHVHIRYCYLKNGSIRYEGSVLNCEQDITNVVPIMSLPLPPHLLPIVIFRKKWIRRNGNNSSCEQKDFRVRRHVVRMWLKYLIKHNPLYKEIKINQIELEKLPDAGDIDDRLPTELLTDDYTTVNEDIDKFVTEIQNGPESGAATGNHNKNPMTENYAGLPPDSMSGLVEEEIFKTMKEKIDEAKDAPVFGWPSIGEKVSDYSYQYVQALAFPTLFPHGVGDYFGGEREVPITLGQSAAHLLKYCYKASNGEWIYPFARNNRWLHWVQNTVERHRFNSQKIVFLQKSPEFANLSDEELKKIIDKNENELKDLLSKMQMYSSNILGSNAYFYKRRTELQGLMEQEGMSRV